MRIDQVFATLYVAIAALALGFAAVLMPSHS
jgi:hypothetical protein